MRDHPPGFCIAHPGYRLKASPARRAQQAIAQVKQRVGAGSSCIEGGMPRDDAHQISAALPLLAPRNLTTIGILGTGSNSEVHYRNYFSMIPLGPDPKREFPRGFFEVAAAQNPKPQTVALVGADAEFGKNSTDGARDNANAAGFKTVYVSRASSARKERSLSG